MLGWPLGVEPRFSVPQTDVVSLGPQPTNELTFSNNHGILFSEIVLRSHTPLFGEGST